ncbi:MMPL family transporter [Thermodesulfobacteriota bacterium]
MGVQAAVREVIADAQIWNLIFALGGVFIFCAINFRSLTAGLILTIPLAVSNVLTFALMGAYHIGLTVNTYPVASVGIGLGVDYGIYFVSRLLEETKKGGDLNQAVYQTLRTNGRVIIQIATTLTVGLLIWIFSALKFQAEMGALLAILLFLNMLGALFLVPTLICILKPKFVRADVSGDMSTIQSDS